MQTIVLENRSISTPPTPKTSGLVFEDILAVLDFSQNNFQYTTEVVNAGLQHDENISKMCMAVSEGALEKVWENEDDEYWESFLK